MLTLLSIFSMSIFRSLSDLTFIQIEKRIFTDNKNPIPTIVSRQKSSPNMSIGPHYHRTPIRPDAPSPKQNDINYYLFHSAEVAPAGPLRPGSIHASALHTGHKLYALMRVLRVFGECLQIRLGGARRVGRAAPTRPLCGSTAAWCRALPWRRCTRHRVQKDRRMMV